MVLHSKEVTGDAAEGVERQARTAVRAHQGVLQRGRRLERRGRGARGPDGEQGARGARRDQGVEEAMTSFGYALSSEEHAPSDLVRYAELAERAGFPFALISDHFHPWIDRQGHSPFVWDVIGAISQRTQKLVLGTGVTCPTMRIHPAIIAQAAATAATLMPGRFFLGVGSGEALNEHILGDRWPPADIRQDMLEEAVEVMRLLWRGGELSHYGEHYVVENARIYDLPDEPVPVMIAAGGEKSAELAGRIGDGLITTAPEK